jgi:hypothetical protein
MSAVNRAQTRGSVRLARIHIHHFSDPLELDAHQKVKDWHNIKVRLISEADRIRQLAMAPWRDDLQILQPPLRNRPLLPSLIPLLPAGSPAVVHPLANDPAPLPFPDPINTRNILFPAGGFSPFSALWDGEQTPHQAHRGPGDPQQ